jgi:hypothetical protein
MPPTAPRKLRKTIADHLVTAISPALIMVLAGSLVFFLAMLLYRGSYPLSLYSTLSWFVFAAVLIVRIDMEVGSERAFLYALALGGVTILFLVRYLDPPFGAILLLGVAWWCAWKLVINCTMIDDDEDATGEGLLDDAGVTNDGPKSEAGTKKRRRPGRLLFEHMATKEARAEAQAARDAEAAEGPQPHQISGTGAPGVWIVYFSMGALPLFGLGEVFLPKDDPDRRMIAFSLLWCYVAAALGLLLTTSFLGLRRYLRRRRLAMPSESVASWLFQGVVISLIILLGCLFLPRPTPGYSVPSLAERVGFGNVRSAPAGKVEQPRDGNAKDARGKPSDKLKGGESSGGSKPGDGPGKNTATPPKANDLWTSSPLEQFQPPKNWFKTSINILFAATGLFILIRYRRELWQGLVALWHDLMSLFRPNEKPATHTSAAPKARPPPRPFSAFKNPFSRPGRSSLAPAELVRYTFEAMQAWATGHDTGRHKDETPLEFANRLGPEAPEAAEAIQLAACRYVELAYANREPAPDSLAGLEKLWRHMCDTAETRGL